MYSKLKLNSECYFSNKYFPKDISYKYYSGDGDFIDVIIELKSIIIFKIKSKKFDNFIFYTKKDNVLWI